MKRSVYIVSDADAHTGVKLLSSKYFNFLDPERTDLYYLEKDTIIINSGVAYNIDFNGSIFLKIRGNMFDALKHFNINYPHTLITSNINYLTSLIKGYIDAGEKLPNGEELIAIRSLPDSARGLGNLVMPFKDIEKFLSLIIILERDKLKEKELRVLLEENGFKRKHYGLCHSEEDEYHLERALMSRRFFIQKVIDVYKEYRLYWHVGMCNIEELLILERENYGLNADGSTMNEIDKGTLKDFLKKEDLNDTVTENIKDTLNKVVKLFNKVKYLAGSIDLYIDTTGNVGCFEFSCEFVMDGCSRETMYRFTENLNKYVFEYKKD